MFSFRSLWSPDFADDPEYQAEAAWADSFCWSGDQQASDLFYEYAIRKLAETEATAANLNAVAAEILRVAGAVAAILAAAAAGLKLPISWPFCVSLSCFLLAIVLVAWSRRPVLYPVLPDIRDVADGIGLAENPKGWLTPTFHKCVVAVRVHNRYKARCLAASQVLVCVGLLTLVGLVVALR